MKNIITSVLVFCAFLFLASCDTPADCRWSQYEGSWVYYMTDNKFDKIVDCTKNTKYTKMYKFTLSYPDKVKDDQGNVGFWTLIYNQGVEVVINNVKYFAYSKYFSKGSTWVSVCNETFPGWFHNSDGTKWGCFFGNKINSQESDVTTSTPSFSDIDLDKPFMNPKAVEDINNAQKLWTATADNEFASKTTREILRMMGNKRQVPKTRKEKQHLTVEDRNLIQALPSSFDWRNVNGKNYMSPARNQMSCGSCYAFGTLASLEARIRILSNLTDQPILSTQDVVSCSNYSQKCDGGFPYLVGKYGEDYGIVEEKCFPYTAGEPACKYQCNNPKRYYFTDYREIGGYYGATTESGMMLEIYKNGPIAINMEVLGDFVAYRSGVYFHREDLFREVKPHFNPFELTNHIVCFLGWGEISGGVKYWIGKNSWGSGWGDGGYFKMIRGYDNCAIESMAEAITPILKK